MKANILHFSCILGTSHDQVFITYLYLINFGLIFHLHSVAYIMLHNIQVNIVSY